MDPDTLRLLKIAGMIAGGVSVMILGVSLLRGHGHHDVPVIQADNKPVRFKPENPGGLQVSGANNDIFSGGSDTANAKLAPAAETPDPKALTALPPAAPPVAAVAPPAPVAVPAPAPAPAVAAKIAAPPAAAPKAAAAHVATPDKKPATGKSAVVQLAAVRSEDAAKQEWHLLAHKYPDLLGGRQPVITKTERDGKTFWRVRTAGFADVAQARGFCDKVKAKGGGCSVADF